MAMNTNYHDRGMKKWQPFFSSPHLKASVLANREEVLATYQAPEVMTESEIDAQLQRAFQERLRVKVTLNVQVAGAPCLLYGAGHWTGGSVCPHRQLTG